MSEAWTEPATTARRRVPAGPAMALAGALGAAVTLLPAAGAQTVYKSVDAEGNVTYTDVPPPSDYVDAHRFELPPDLTEEQRQAAAARREEVMREADFAGEYREPRASPAEIREAERRVAEARRKLEDYEIVRDDDWGGTYQGKRGLKPGYSARVDAARKELADAQAQLETLRRQGR